jgi:DNA-binding CsgD family transcriptional regulator
VHPGAAPLRDTRDPGPAKISDFLTRRAFRRTELYRSVHGPMGVEMAVTLPAAAGAVVGIALNRDRHDFDERERDRVMASLLERVADADGRAIVAVRPDGSVAFASSGAWELLAGHLPPAAAPGRLPEALAAWIARRRRGLEPAAVFTADGPAGGLTGRWLPAAAPGDPDAVLLERQSSLPSPATLAYLGLSRRQAEVLALVARGHTNGQVAQSLGVSPRTVQKHLEHIFDRLGVRTRAAATARALGANAAA